MMVYDIKHLIESTCFLVKKLFKIGIQKVKFAGQRYENLNFVKVDFINTTIDNCWSYK